MIEVLSIVAFVGTLLGVLWSSLPDDLLWQMLSGLSKYMRKSAKEKEKK